MTKKIYTKKSTKKAFTLLELIFAIVLAAIISYFGLMQYLQHLKNQRIEAFLNNVNSVINIAIIDPIQGYVNGTGGYCSDDNTYRNITACRAIKCAKLDNIFSLYEKSGNCDTNYNDSYIQKLFLTDTNGKGCNIYIKPDSSDSTIFYLYIDCSNITNSRERAEMEDFLKYDMRENFNLILQDIYPNATGINNINGGNSSDGKIMFKFKK